jgi:predicted PurR-regulated permease PerM
MAETARKAFIATLVVLAVVVLALTLWKLKLLLGLLFLAFILAAAMRPAIDALKARGVPRGVGVALHYLAFAALLALVVWLAVPRAIHQVDQALGPEGRAQLTEQARQTSGVKHDILISLRNRLQHVDEAELVRPAAEVTVKAFEVLIGVFFVFAAGAYWIFERDRAEDVVCSLLPRPKRKVVRDTWNLIDLKLGAFVRGQALLIVGVAVVLSLLFWAIGLPYWLLVGCFAGLVEIVPVIGPLAAGALAVGVGLTESVHTAVLAAACVLGVRLLEDYIVLPRVLGDATGLSPLVVLVSVTSVGILFGGFAVLFAVPIAAVLVTLIDVIVRDKDPAEEEVPAVIFSAQDVESSRR